MSIPLLNVVLLLHPLAQRRLLRAVCRLGIYRRMSQRMVWLWLIKWLRGLELRSKGHRGSLPRSLILSHHRRAHRSGYMIPADEFSVPSFLSCLSGLLRV